MVETTPYERFMAILNGEKKNVNRIPCINSVSVSTIEFMKTYDAYWPEAHKDPIKMAKLGSAAHRLCGLDNVSVPFCMTVEAEVLGAVIDFHEDNIKWPSVRGFHLEDPSELKFPKDVSKVERVPVIMKAIRILKKEFEGKVPVNAYIVPPFTSLSSYVVDSITFLKWLRKAPEKVHQFCKDTLDLYAEIANLYKDAGADVITFHEMGASTDNISPNHFEEFVKPYLKEIIRQLKVPTILNICGSALMIVNKMVECGANAIAVDERTPIKKAREEIDRIKPEYPLIGNVPSYGVLHQGPVERIGEAVKSCIEDGVDIVAPGCDFWLETPTDNIKAFVDACIKYGTPPPWKK
jgi:[methyl-Co(III) methanol-specific corrinoid protein]:coenzyme M methyltransferase